MFKCPNCSYQSEKINSLRIHSQKSHKLSSEDLYLAVVVQGPQPTCECGCGEKTRFQGLIKGYSKYRRGHVARIKNNWGHNEIAREKSKKTRQEMSERGELISWCAGLTKDDPRLAPGIEKMKNKILSNPEELARRSSHMKEQWASGNIKPLRKEKHSQWKGGVSSLSTLCHSNQRLYKEWKYPKLVAAGFKCERCNSTDSLHVHHSETRMADLVNEVRRSQPDVLCDHESLTPMVNQVIDLHTIRDVPGLVLCSACHCLEHPSLNF